MNPNAGRTGRDLRRCQEAVYASRALLKETLYLDSISLAYYAAVHAAMLILAAAGHATRSPEQAERMFADKEAKDLGITPELQGQFHEVSRLKKQSEGDYLAKYSSEAARDMLAKSAAFVAAVERCLAA